MTNGRKQQGLSGTATSSGKAGLLSFEGRRFYAGRRLFAASSALPEGSLWLHFGRALVSTALSMALVAQPFLTQASYAQVVSDPTAPIQFKPTVGTSANGTPTVNIVTPSFGGVSHNKYQNYDVDTRGVILNNSALGGTSVIGGKVGGNPNLAGQAPARVIINEVTGSSASSLNGPTEVFGTRADVIVANPNGVACISCAFINTGRVTLTTGTPNPNYDTGAVSYSVTRGTVSISGNGLNGGSGVNASGQAGLVALGDIDLIGRQLQVNGPVLSKGDVRLRAGAINYDQNADLTTPIAGTAAVDGPAIASSASGTITAGSLSVLSADVDLAVDLTGDIATLDGSLTVKSAGDVTLAKVTSDKDIAVSAAGTATFKGSAQALGRITADARDITVTDPAVLAANDAIVLQALNTIGTSGTIESGTAATLTAGGDVTASGTIVSNGQVALEGANVHTSNLSVGGSVVTVSGLNAVSLDDTGIASAGDIRISAPSISLGQQTGFQVGGTITLDAAQDFSTDSILNYPNLSLVVRNNLAIGAHGGLFGDNLDVSVTDSIDNAGLIYGRLSTVLGADGITNEATGVIYGPDVTLQVGSSLGNLGQILSDRTLRVLANGAGVVNDGLIQSNGTLTLTSASYTSHSAQGALAAATATLIVSGALDNAGSLLGTQTLDASAGSLTNESTGSIRGATASLATAGDLDNEGLVGAVTDLTIAAGDVVNHGNLIAANGTLALDAGSTASSGTIAAGDTVRLTGGLYDGSASSELGAGTVSVDLSGLFHNAGLVAADTTLTLKAGSLAQDEGGTLYGGSTADLTLAGAGSTGGMVDNAGAIVGTDLTVKAAGLVNQATGTIKAGLADIITTGDLTNQGSIAALGLLGATVGGALDNEGTLQSDQDIGLDVAGAWTNNGTATAKGTLVANAASLANGAGGHIQAKSLQLGVTGDAVNQGTIASDTDLVLQAGSLTNAGAGGTVAEISGQDLTAIVKDALSNGPYALLQGLDTATIAAGTSNLDLTHSNDIAGGQFNFGKSLTYELTASGLTIDAGKTLEVDGKLAIQVSGDLDILGTVASAGDLYLQSTGGSINIGNADVNNPGGAEVFTLGNATLVSAKDIVNNDSLIQAEGDIGLVATGKVQNLRMGAMVWPAEFQAWLDGAYPADAHRAPAGWYLRAAAQRSGQFFFYYAQTDEFPNAYASIEAGGSILIQASELDNTGSAIAANQDLVVRAQTVSNQARSSEVYRQKWRVQGSSKGARGGPILVTADKDKNALVQSPELPVLFAGGTIDIQDANGAFNLAGTLEGQYIHIDGHTVTTGISDPNEFVLPDTVPQTSIDLASYFVGAGAVNAGGTGATAPTSVTENGITYLHGAPIAPAGQRDPSWILGQVGDSRSNLTFFADPLTEQNLIEKAVISETGRALLDPKYKDPAGQQQALWQGTVGFLKTNPDIHLGDTLTEAQKASITQPILWYTNDNGVLTPELLLPKNQVDALTKQMGGMVLGQDIAISGDAVTNTGNLIASDKVLISAGGFLDNQRAVYDGWDAHLQDGGSIKAADIGILTLGDLDVAGGSLAASGTITLQSLMGDVNILPQTEQVVTRTFDDQKVTTVTQTLAAGADIKAGGALDITASSGNIIVEASNLKANGISLDAANLVKFLAGTDETLVEVAGKSDNGITITHYDHGSDTTSLVYDTIDAGAGGLKVSAPGGVVMDLGEGEATGKAKEAIFDALHDGKPLPNLAGLAGAASLPAATVIAGLAQQPGLGWMDQIAGDPNLSVSYNALNTVATTWNNDVTTLSPVATLVIGLAISVLVPALGTALGTALGLGTSVFTAIGDAVSGALTTAFDIGSSLVSVAISDAVAAGVTAFVSSTATGVLEGAITGNLDIGNVLMGALAAGLTAGILQGINGAFFPQAPNSFLLAKGLGGLGKTFEQLTSTQILEGIGEVLVDAPIQAGINSLLTGADFKDGLVADLKGDFVNDVFEPVGFSYVGGVISANHLSTFNPAAVLLHAAVGGTGGFIVNGVKGAEGGALGAALGELLTGIDQKLPASGSILNRQDFMQLVGGLASIAVGDTSLAGENAALDGYEYNYLSHDQVVLAIKDLNDCKTSSDPDCAAKALKFWLDTSTTQQNMLMQCGDNECFLSKMAELQTAYKDFLADGDATALISAGGGFLSDLLRQEEAPATQQQIYTEVALGCGGAITEGCIQNGAHKLGVGMALQGVMIIVGGVPFPALSVEEGWESAVAEEGAGSTIAANRAAGKAAEAEVTVDISGQGITVDNQVSLSNGSVRCVADCALNGLPNQAVQVPNGYVVEDPNGTELVDASGNPITSFNLNSSGQAFVEVKAGGGSLTKNQTTVYPTVQAGTARGVGSNANAAGAGGPISATPVIVLRKM